MKENQLEAVTKYSPQYTGIKLITTLHFLTNNFPLIALKAAIISPDCNISSGEDALAMSGVHRL